MKRLLLTALTALTSVIGIAAGQDVDSYKVYRVDAVADDQTVSLQGQFDVAPVVSKLNQLVSFANPVDIDGEGIQDPRRHLTWYSLQDPVSEPRRLVEVTNRFGQLRLTLGQPVFLLVPAESKTAGSTPPADLDHYKVYEVAQAKCTHRADRHVDLNDRFGVDNNVEVRFPRYFAVPVEKTVNGRRFPIKNPAHHLTIYEIRERNYALDPLQVEDQFGARPLTIRRSELLCVPSLKREITPPQGLDYLQFYDVTDRQVHQSIRVRDQFDRTSVSTQLHKLTHFATAARINDDDVANQDASFTVYRIDQLKADPIRMVQVWNRLGEQQLWIGAAHHLLVPAKLRAGNAFADDLDYYVCYSIVRPGSFAPQQATFQDSLGQSRKVTAMKPVLFCVPAEGGQEGIHDEQNHLIIYRITPREEPELGNVEVEDRFGVHTLDPQQNSMLGVPTLKFEVFPPPRRFGRLQ